MSKFDAKTLLQIFGMFAVLVALMPIYCKDIYKKVIKEKMRDKTFLVCSFRGIVVKMVLMECAW
ncbi:hypothetical protein HMPREF9304_09660 [Hoylesella timonensis S9-PR14]|uniref:Uncharacterized protein n=1 Tax=Hoylesella timonensis S9-PR14 TaxID=1401062 RepID=A0A098YQI9_9BACT|nr:hypothetical protein HMPREF9304_09660 [Hoylesella timonensis S9-PR14]